MWNWFQNPTNALVPPKTLVRWFVLGMQDSESSGAAAPGAGEGAKPAAEPPAKAPSAATAEGEAAAGKGAVPDLKEDATDMDTTDASVRSLL